MVQIDLRASHELFARLNPGISSPAGWHAPTGSRGGSGFEADEGPALGASDIYLKFYVGDYLADTGDLSTEENGALLLLLFHMWRRGAQLEADQDRLRRLARVDSAERWKSIWGAIGRFFFDVGNGMISQKRLAAEHQRAAEYAAQQRARGAIGGSAPRSKRRASAKQVLSDRQASQSHSQSHVQKSGPEAQPFGNGFGVWYAGYPRKVARDAAERAWAKNVTDDNREAVWAGWIAQERFWAAQKAVDDTKIPHPASWLNGKRWQDDPASYARLPGSNGSAKGVPSTATRNAFASILAKEGAK